MSAGRYGGVRVLIPTGFGLNCEAETAHAFRALGAEPDLVHWTDLFAHRHGRRLADYDVLVFVGGFSYGDHIAGGLVLATRIRARLLDDLRAFLDRGGYALGICNGFQTLLRLGLLPGPDAPPHDFEPRADLAPNDRLGYRDAWVTLRVEPDTRCAWLRGIDRLEVPSRHGEGRFVVADDAELERLERRGAVVLRYVGPDGEPTEAWPHNPNGSRRGVAGITDATGRILGLMPHPDAFLHPWHHPRALVSDAPEDEFSRTGLAVFRAGLEAAASR
ncbi:MAG: phosphoribosylformylglycinamidine synthase subunit PurQ [Acidobacteriota bacterium]